jgi:HEAT repeat protein
MADEPALPQRSADAVSGLEPAAPPRADPETVAAIRGLLDDVVGVRGVAVRFGALAVPALLELVADPGDAEDPNLVRLRAIDTLGEIGPPAAAAEATLFELPASDQLDVQESGAVALAGVAAGRSETVNRLIARLGGPSAAGRASSARVLGRMGPAAAEAVPSLIGRLTDPDREVRRCAAGGLGQIGSAAAPAVPALVRLLNSEDRWDARAAAWSLARIASDPDIAVPALTAALSRREVRHAAALALAGLGPAAAHLIPEFVRLLKDSTFAEEAANVLGAFGPLAVAAVPALVSGLTNPPRRLRMNATWRFREAAVRALGKIGSAEAIPALEAVAEHDAPRVREAAAQALQRLGRSSPSVEVGPAATAGEIPLPPG